MLGFREKKMKEKSNFLLRSMNFSEVDRYNVLYDGF